MGCDIHFYVERKNKDTGKWEALHGPNHRISMYREWAERARTRGEEEKAVELEKQAADLESGEKYNAEMARLDELYPAAERAEDPDLEREYQREKLSDYDAPTELSGWAYSGRNYDLFGILANVRNGVGFAGVKTGEGFIPILMDLYGDQYKENWYVRGLPEDLSPELQAAADYWDGDGHSHNWLTVQEVLDYSLWEKGDSVHYGWVSETVYKQFKENGDPYPCCGGISGGGVVHVSNEQMEDIISGKFPKEEGKSYYTQISWTEGYKDAAGSFYTRTIPMLVDMAGDDLDSVRLVFWFDN